MKQIQVVLRDIDVNGQIFQWDDQTIWSEPLLEFHLSCKIIEDIKAEVFVLPEKEGCLFRGKIRGKVSQPCDRCADETIFPISFDFDEFEEYPLQNLDEDNVEDQGGDNRVIIVEKGVILLDFGALLWEEFILTLPTKPLCNIACKGICSECGENLNESICVCENEGKDPRMEALRNLKIQ